MTNKTTLYERLGGVYLIAAVVDDFIDRVMHNPILMRTLPLTKRIIVSARRASSTM
jgi:hypothetical protein